MKTFKQFTEKVNESYKNQDKFKSYLIKLKNTEEVEKVKEDIKSILDEEQVEEFNIEDIVAVVKYGVVTKVDKTFYMLQTTKDGYFQNCELDLPILKKLK